MPTMLVIQSGPPLRNAGDLAMLNTAISRLSQRAPDSTFLVLADCAERLARNCPQARWVPAAGLNVWAEPWLGRRTRCLPGAVRTAYARSEQLVRRRAPRLAESIASWKAQRRNAGAALQALRQAMAQADAVIATGGGYLNDEFPYLALNVLRLLAWAVQAGKPVVLLGQGIGPVTDAAVAAAARYVLPRVDLIALREARASQPLLRAWGVADDRILVTGDDAIEMAYAARRAALGDAVGLNVRKARYAGVTDAHIAAVGAAVRAAAATLQASIQPLPIATQPEDDAVAIARAMRLPGPLPAAAADDDPVAAIMRVSACRVVVTGSYHAAVFALAQGIPAVGLAGSRYYFDKFYGLAEQFGAGCTVLDLNDPELEQRLTAALLTGWQTADALRPTLLAAAARQILAGQEAYQRVAVIVGERGSRP